MSRPFAEFVLVSLGLLIGLVMDLIWKRYGLDKYEMHLEFIEHYHIGLILVAIGNPLSVGAGIALLIKESEQSHPFALGSNHFRLSTAIGAALLLLTLLSGLQAVP